MGDVLIGLAPAVLAALYFFGISALLLMLAATAGCLVAERAFGATPGASIRDGSAALTGVLLALTLPPGLPLWMAFLGGLVAIALGKTVWGGLGHNLFNQALVGRAVLQSAFPTAMTTWATSSSGFFTLRAESFAVPMMQAKADAVSAATPLAQMKFEQQATETLSLLLGNTSGSLGETSAIAIVLGGVYLLARRTFDWRIPAAIVTGVVVFSGALYLVDSARFAPPHFMLLAGGMMFGTLFMATDPVTSPMAPRGAWIFGLGIGFFVVLIRVFGGLPEGMMYSILLMNAATPLIERATQPKPFGRSEA